MTALLCQDAALDDMAVYDFVPCVSGLQSFCLHRELLALQRNHFADLHRGVVSVPPGSCGLARRTVFELPQRTREGILNVTARYGNWPPRRLAKRARLMYSRKAPASEELSRPQKVAVYTIGYEGKSVDRFFAELLAARIEAILDVRENPVSRKYGFAKRTLANLARSLSLGYEHMPSLGVPAGLRRSLADPAARRNLLQLYQEELLPQREGDVRMLAEKLRERPSVLMCMESDAARCHRGRLAQAVAQVAGLRVDHL